MVKNTWRDIPVRNDLTIAQNIHLRLDNQASALDLEVIRILVTIVVRYPNRRRLQPSTTGCKLDLECGRATVGRHRRTRLRHRKGTTANYLHRRTAGQLQGRTTCVENRKRTSQRTAYFNITKVRVVNCTRSRIAVNYLLTIAKDCHLRPNDSHLDIVKFTSV